MLVRQLTHAALVAVLFALSFAVTSAVAAVTDNLYPTANANWFCLDYGTSDNKFCKTDNENLVYFFQSSTNATIKNSVRSTMNNDFGPNTDLNVSETTTPVYDGDAETDTIYQRDNSGLSGDVGRTWCQNAVSANRCDQHYVRYNTTDNIGVAPACHETGHSVGLTHGSNADPQLDNFATQLHCLRTPLPTTETYLGENNRENINAGY